MRVRTRARWIAGLRTLLSSWLMHVDTALVTLLSIVVSAPAVLAGQLFRQGDAARGTQVALAELIVVALAAVITHHKRRSVD
jgi:hypothetical protein